MGAIINNRMHHQYRSREELRAIDELVLSAAMKAGARWRTSTLLSMLDSDIRSKFKVYALPAQQALVKASFYRLRKAGRLVFNEETQFWSVAKRTRSATRSQ